MPPSSVIKKINTLQEFDRQITSMTSGFDKKVLRAHCDVLWTLSMHGFEFEGLSDKMSVLSDLANRKTSIFDALKKGNYKFRPVVKVMNELEVELFVTIEILKRENRSRIDWKEPYAKLREMQNLEEILQGKPQSFEILNGLRRLMMSILSGNCVLETADEYERKLRKMHDSTLFPNKTEEDFKTVYFYFCWAFVRMVQAVANDETDTKPPSCGCCNMDEVAVNIEQTRNRFLEDAEQSRNRRDGSFDKNSDTSDSGHFASNSPGSSPSEDVKPPVQQQNTQEDSREVGEGRKGVGGFMIDDPVEVRVAPPARDAKMESEDEEDVKPTTSKTPVPTRDLPYIGLNGVRNTRTVRPRFNPGDAAELLRVTPSCFGAPGAAADEVDDDAILKLTSTDPAVYNLTLRPDHTKKGKKRANKDQAGPSMRSEDVNPSCGVCGAHFATAEEIDKHACWDPSNIPRPKLKGILRTAPRKPARPIEPAKKTPQPVPHDEVVTFGTRCNKCNWNFWSTIALHRHIKHDHGPKGKRDTLVPPGRFYPEPKEPPKEKKRKYNITKDKERKTETRVERKNGVTYKKPAAACLPSTSAMKIPKVKLWEEVEVSSGEEEAPVKEKKEKRPRTKCKDCREKFVVEPGKVQRSRCGKCMLEYYEDTREHRLEQYMENNVFDYKEMKQDENMLLSDLAVEHLQMTVVDMHSYNDNLWEKTRAKLEVVLTENEKKECEKTLPMDSDKDFITLLYVTAYLNRSRAPGENGLGRVKHVLRKMVASGETTETAIDRLQDEGQTCPTIFTLKGQPGHFLSIDLEAIPILSGLRNAMLAVVAATILFFVNFDERIGDVVRFFYVEAGLDLDDLPESVQELRELIHL